MFGLYGSWNGHLKKKTPSWYFYMRLKEGGESFDECTVQRDGFLVFSDTMFGFRQVNLLVFWCHKELDHKSCPPALDLHLSNPGIEDLSSMKPQDRVALMEFFLPIFIILVLTYLFLSKYQKDWSYREIFMSLRTTAKSPLCWQMYWGSVEITHQYCDVNVFGRRLSTCMDINFIIVYFRMWTKFIPQQKSHLHLKFCIFRLFLQFTVWTYVKLTILLCCSRGKI